MSLSILNSTKKLLGIDPMLEAFDLDLILDINTVFTTLHQMGLGKTVFTISDATKTWDDYTDNLEVSELVKTYMVAKVRSMFDPPSGAVAEALNKTIDELEWRISIIVDKGVDIIDDRND